MDKTDALVALRAEITPGWRVRITDHSYINDSRDDAKVIEVRADHLIIRPKRPWSSQGRTFPTMTLSWGGDWEVDGRTVRLYVTDTAITSRTTPGVRRLAKTFTFTPPKEY